MQKHRCLVIERQPTSFSVVIPLYNKGPHISDAIESVLSQELAPTEIIIVDDASTDGGREIAESIKDSRIKVFSRTNPGPGGYAARNLGIQQALGEWIAFLDGDDVWKPNHLKKLDEAIRLADSDVICAFSRFQVMENGKSRAYEVSPKLLIAPQPLSADKIIAAWLDTRKCPLWTGAVALRKDKALEAGLFPEGQARRGGDKDLWLRVILMGGTAFSPSFTSEFHQDTVNRVSNSTAFHEPPIIAKSIRIALQNTQDSSKNLLRRLLNQEVSLYVRRSAATGNPVGLKFLKELYYPEGLSQIFTFAILDIISFPISMIRALGIARK